MKNREFYRDQIMNENYGVVGENTFCCKFVKPYVLKTSDCSEMQCTQCYMIQSIWLDEEYEEPKEPEVDWSQVAVDTPILVSGDKIRWSNRHFCKYEDGTVFAYNSGATSWSSNCDAISWKYAKLAEVNK